MSFAPKVAFHGFDRTTNPVWQMVPVKGKRVLTISGHGTLAMRVGNPHRLTVDVTKSGRSTILTLTGGEEPSWAYVEWVRDRTSKFRAERGYRLQVSVKAPKIVSTAFHYVDDGKKQKTRRKIADLDKLIEAANRILTPQANVILKRKSAAALPITEDLGRVVRHVSTDLRGAPHNVPASEHEWDILKGKRDTSADYNVFFVKAYEQDATPNHDDADAAALASDQMCVLEDSLGHPAAEVLAHETVHALGVGDHSASRSYLMATGANGLGWFINRAQADVINPSGT